MPSHHLLIQVAPRPGVCPAPPGQSLLVSLPSISVRVNWELGAREVPNRGCVQHTFRHYHDPLLIAADRVKGISGEMPAINSTMRFWSRSARSLTFSLLAGLLGSWTVGRVGAHSSISP